MPFNNRWCPFGFVVQLKSMGISFVEQFPFPTSPPAASLHSAIETLANLGAITRVRVTQSAAASSDWDTGASSGGAPAGPVAVVDERLTTVGEQLVPFPVAPRLGKILLVGKRVGVINFALAAVAALSAQV